MRKLLALICFLGAGPAFAATITHEDLGDGVQIIAIEGDIKSGDEETFRRLAVQYSTAIVALDSQGGLLVPSLEIGRMIHLREFNTIVIDGDQCASACALIWIAGAKRYLMPQGSVGFHASYLDLGGKQVESGVANALIGRYMTQLELPERAVIYATSAPPSTIRWLTPDGRANAGISFEIFTGKSSESVAVASASSTSGGWRVAAVSEDNQSIKFVNTDRVERNGDIVRFWQDSWWSKATRTANRSQSLIEANCRTKAFRQLSLSYYMNERYHDKDDSASTVDYALPESMMEGAIDAICHAKYRSPAVTDRMQAVARIRGRN